MLTLAVIAISAILILRLSIFHFTIKFVLYTLLVVLIAFLANSSKFFRRLLFGLLAVLLVLFIAIQTTVVQNWLVKAATKKLSNALGTEVSIKHVSFSLLNSANLEGTFIQDKNKDTLLYAGAVKVRITDWFFLKDKAVLKYVGLEDAVVKLNRKDSVWNYQYIVDYFSSPTKKQNNNSGGINLNLKKVDFKNVHFINDDRWVGEKLEAYIGSFVVDAENVDFNKKIFEINDITIDKPIFSIHNFTALKPPTTKKVVSIDTGLVLNPAHLFVKATSIKINNGNFINEANNNAALKFFDGEHLNFSNINASFKNLFLHNDTLKTAMVLSTKERCGLEVKKLQANVKATPQVFQFANLNLQTNKSQLTNFYEMRFEHFNKDFANYETNVVMNATFNNSKVFSDDIAFFAPALATWKKEVEISGNFIGTVANFSITNLFAKTGETFAKGTLAMKGLPNINDTKINFNNGILQTNAKDLGIFIPALKNIKEPNLPALGTIVYNGNFNGYLNNFTSVGNIKTNLGYMYANVNMQFPKNADAIYNATINAKNFNLGTFINYDKIGAIDFDGKIYGHGFGGNNVKTTLDGGIKQLYFNGYNYTNIITKGTFQKQYFTGEVKINDQNLDFTSAVEIDLSKQQPKFNMFGDLVKSNFKALKLTQDNVQLTGTLDANFTGNNIDNFLGQAKLLNAIIKNDESTISFDSLNLTSQYLGNKKHLRLGSNEFVVSVQGQFSILDLPKSFQSFLHRYYPNYINDVATIPQDQDFTVSITTNYIEPYLKLFNKKLNGFNDAKIEGVVNTKANKLNVAILVPNFSYDKYAFTGIDLNGSGNLDSLTLKGDINSVQLSDSFYLPTVKLYINSTNDHSVVGINTKANNTLNDASLLADVYTLDDGARIHFQPSSFVINDKKWFIEKAGELVLRKQFVAAKDVKFTQGFQEITLETDDDGGESNDNILNLKLKNVVLGDFAALANFKDPRVEGLLTGQIKLKDFLGNFVADANLKAEQFRLDEDSLGLVNLKANYNSKTGNFIWDIVSPNEKFNFASKGSYKTKDETNNPLNTDIVLKNTRLTIIQKYLKSVFTNLDGFGTGILKITGNGKNLNLLGDVQIKNAGLKVNYTQVYYYIDSAVIKFEEDGINLGAITMYDDSINAKQRNSGIVQGKIYETGFKNMNFDIDFSTQKLLLLNTKALDNQQFYGKAIGKASLSFKGPESNAKMIIVGEANDSSHIYLPNSFSKESGDADFIVFKQFGTEMENAVKESSMNISVDLDLTANEKVNIDVILDEIEGDVIKAQGKGRLKIKAGTKEKLDIRGRYNIAKGSYDFNFQSIFRKPFTLLGNDSYIEWTGDPLKAEVHIDAQYRAEKISLGDLINKSGFTTTDNALKAQRGDVFVIAQLRDKLMQPSIKFKIDFPDNSPAKTNQDFVQFLSRIEKDENEMLTQAASLIMFNSFTPYGQGLLSNASSSYTTIGVNTISKKIIAEVNKQVSNFLYMLFKDKNLKFDLDASVYSGSNIFGNGLNATNANRLDRTNVNFKIGKSLFNDNVVVTFGGDIDFGFGASAAQSGNLQWLPDLNIEVILSKDKKLRAIIFNKNSLDISSTNVLGRRNRQGISISYKQESETFLGILTSKKSHN